MTAPCDEHQSKESVETSESWNTNHSLQLDGEARPKHLTTKSEFFEDHMVTPGHPPLSEEF